MLTRRLLLTQQLTRWSCLTKTTRCSSKFALDSEIGSEMRLIANKPQLPTREPFAKNLLIRKFDAEFLAYPEPQSPNRYRDFHEWLKPIEEFIKTIDSREIDKSAKIPDKIFEEFQKLGVFRAPIEESYGGLGLNNTEYTKLVETVSAVPVLGTFLINRAHIVSLIKEFGTEQQKADVFPKMATNILRPCLCFSEHASGSWGECLETKATQTSCQNFYTINGTKTWAIDATNANLFVVIAQSSTSDTFVKGKSVGAFLVPADEKGITISEPEVMLGQKGLDVCTVTFNNVQIPSANEIGKGVLESELYTQVLSFNKHYISGQAIGILKRFLNLVTIHMIKDKNFNLRQANENSMQELIGEIATSLYSMEATTYLTTGMMDIFEKQDCVVEQSLAACYCTETCVNKILQGLEYLGMSAYWNGEPFEQLLRDATALITHNRSTVDGKIFATLLSIQYMAKSLAGPVKELRNPMLHPWKQLRRIWSSKNHEKLYLMEYVHPSLQGAAENLEYTVNHYANMIEAAITTNGPLIVQDRMMLRRLADVFINTYVTTAVLSRASRSYCIGLRNADHDVRIALFVAHCTKDRARQVGQMFGNSDFLQINKVFKSIADEIFKKKSYFAEHPLERTHL